tara:strand:- start:831 stop:1046 length:216 start_codon:yes stop_codon:yes gene_type:complete
MCLKASSEFLQLENWLTILITTYKDQPTCGLAKTINYYLDYLLSHEDINSCGKKRCEYLVMRKFWEWQAQN